MNYTKVTCKYGKCDKCNNEGYLMIAEQPIRTLKQKRLLTNKPHGTGANDRKF
ncbi:hypothetical protein BH10ACI1_BH10ACI1_02650 [soil metagenome]